MSTSKSSRASKSKAGGAEEGTKPSSRPSRASASKPAIFADEDDAYEVDMDCDEDDKGAANPKKRKSAASAPATAAAISTPAATPARKRQKHFHPWGSCVRKDLFDLFSTPVSFVAQNQTSISTSFSSSSSSSSTLMMRHQSSSSSNGAYSSYQESESIELSFSSPKNGKHDAIGASIIEFDSRVRRTLVLEQNRRCDNLFTPSFTSNVFLETILERHPGTGSFVLDPLRNQSCSPFDASDSTRKAGSVERGNNLRMIVDEAKRLGLKQQASLFEGQGKIAFAIFAVLFFRTGKGWLTIDSLVKKVKRIGDEKPVYSFASLLEGSSEGFDDKQQQDDAEGEDEEQQVSKEPSQGSVEGSESQDAASLALNENDIRLEIEKLVDLGFLISSSNSFSETISESQNLSETVASNNSPDEIEKGILLLDSFSSEELHEVFSKLSTPKGPKPGKVLTDIVPKKTRIEMMHHILRERYTKPRKEVKTIKSFFSAKPKKDEVIEIMDEDESSQISNLERKDSISSSDKSSQASSNSVHFSKLGPVAVNLSEKCLESLIRCCQLVFILSGVYASDVPKVMRCDLNRFTFPLENEEFADIKSCNTCIEFLFSSLDLLRDLLYAIPRGDVKTCHSYIDKLMEMMLTMKKKCPICKSCKESLSLVSIYSYRLILIGCMVGINLFEKEALYEKAIDYSKKLLDILQGAKEFRTYYADLVTRICIDYGHNKDKDAGNDIMEQALDPSNLVFFPGAIPQYSNAKATYSKGKYRYFDKTTNISGGSSASIYLRYCKAQEKAKSKKPQPALRNFNEAPTKYVKLAKPVDNPTIRVEQLVLDYYENHHPDQGIVWHGKHYENGIFLTLFTLLMWDVLFTKDAKITRFSDFPCTMKVNELLDLPQTQKILNEVNKGNAKSIIKNTWEKHYEQQARGVNWTRSSLEELLRIAECLGPKILCLVCEIYLEDYDAWLGGVSDLLVFTKDPLTPQCRFVEVKSPTDRLSDKQRAWFDKLIIVGAEVEEFRVEYVAATDPEARNKPKSA